MTSLAQQWDRFCSDPTWVFETYFRIPHRDRPGRFVPFVLNHAQRRCLSVTERVLAVSVLRSALKHGKTDMLSELAGSDMATGAWSARVEQIARAGVWGVVHRIRKQDPRSEEWLDFGPVRLVIGKGRRQGLSTFVQGLFFWLSIIIPGLKVMVMAHDQESTENVLTIAGGIYDMWPEASTERQGADDDPRNFRPELDSRAGHRLKLDNRSTYQVKTAGAKDSTRSFQFDAIHFSEFGYYVNQDNVGAAAAGAPRHCWVWKESTGNGPAGAFYEDWRKAITIDDLLAFLDSNDTEALTRWETEGAGLIRFFTSYIEDPGYRLDIRDMREKALLAGSLDDYEAELVENHGVTLEQIKWRRWKKSDLRNDKGLTEDQFFAQEFPLNDTEMFQSSSRRVFDAKRVQTLQLQASRPHNQPLGYWRVYGTSPPEKALPHQANLWIWEKPERGSYYIVSADVAQGLAHGDRSVAKVFHRMDGIFMREVACYEGRPDAEQFADVVALLADMYNDAFVIPEVTGLGLATVNRLQRLRIRNIYRQEVMNRVDLDPDIPTTFRVGFHVTPSSKNAVVPMLVSAINEGLIDLRHPRSFGELLAYERGETKAGRTTTYSAPKGSNDDHVSALALACFAQRGRTNAPAMVDQSKRAQPDQFRKGGQKQSELPERDRRAWEAVLGMRKKAAKQQRRAEQKEARAVRVQLRGLAKRKRRD